MLHKLLKRVRRTPERLLHPLRRRQALEALASRPRPLSVLTVCHGNICRSPFAGALLAHALARLGISVQSAGFVGFNRPAPPEAVAAAERYGIALGNHRSRLITSDLVRAVELIVVMEPAQQRLVCERYGRPAGDVLVLGDLDPDAVETRAIRDPVNERRDVFDEVYERIARCARALVGVLGRSTPTTAGVAAGP